MTDTEVPGGAGFVTERGSFRAAHVADQNIDRQAFVLDQMAVRPAVRRMLDRDGAVELLGADRFHGNVHRAVAALGAARPAAQEPPAGQHEGVPDP